MVPAERLEPDPLITNQMLYQLSYTGASALTSLSFSPLQELSKRGLKAHLWGDDNTLFGTQIANDNAIINRREGLQTLRFMNIKPIARMGHAIGQKSGNFLIEIHRAPFFGTPRNMTRREKHGAARQSIATPPGRFWFRCHPNASSRHCGTNTYYRPAPHAPHPTRRDCPTYQPARKIYSATGLNHHSR